MSGNRRAIGSDLAKVDGHEVGPNELAESPELGEDWFDRAVAHVGGRPAKRGRPRAVEPKQAVNLRLSPRVIARFRAGGAGWQTRINAALEDWLKDHP